MPVLKQELERCQMALPADWLWADSFLFAKKQWGIEPSTGSRALQALRVHYQLPEEQVCVVDAPIVKERNNMLPVRQPHSG